MKIEFKEFQNGQTQLGKLDLGVFYSMDNCDAHTEIGILQPQLALVSESTTPNEPCFSVIVPSGDMYFFSQTTGKTWKRAYSNGAYTLANTNANTTGHRGCRYFNGYVWYWTASKLGYFNLASTWTDSFATFKSGNARGCVEANNTLVIGDGRYLARIDGANTFDDDAFTLPAAYLVTDLINVGDDILIGTYVGVNVSYCRIFLWNTLDTAWTVEDEVFEAGVNNFMRLDNYILAQCGTEGRLYMWTGGSMDYFGKIRGATTGLGEQKTTIYRGRPLIAIGTKIYSIHREDKRFNYAIIGEYTATGTIASLSILGSILYASVGTGIDKVGTTYATAVVETSEVRSKFNGVIVNYDTYPTGISLQTKLQNGSYGTAKTMIDNSNERNVYYDGGEATNAVFQVKVTLTPSEANIPKITSIILN